MFSAAPSKEPEIDRSINYSKETRAERTRAGYCTDARNRTEQDICNDLACWLMRCGLLL